MENDRSVYHAYYREKARFATYDEYEEAMADFLNGN
jgi:flagellum-specific peptidoglycan hydrolase FlgJ